MTMDSLFFRSIMALYHLILLLVIWLLRKSWRIGARLIDLTIHYAKLRPSYLYLFWNHSKYLCLWISLYFPMCMDGIVGDCPCCCITQSYFSSEFVWCLYNFLIRTFMLCHLQFTILFVSIFGYHIYACVICWQEAPAVVQSFYSRRIVGCPGGEGGKLLNLPGLSGWKLYSDRVK